MNLEVLSDVSPLAWAVTNEFISENDRPLEFVKHRFMIQPFNDLHPNQVTMKSAQVGWSVTNIIKAKWLLKKMGLNIIYVLPTQDIVKDFVIPKVDPLIIKNPAIAEMVTKDNITLKQVGDRFIYYRGAFSERKAISLTCDVVIVDELDRCSDLGIINTFESRMQASDYAWLWKFSNPTVPNFGVHELWLDSDQMHWIMTCHHCKHASYITFEKEVAYLTPKGKEHFTHYVDVPNEKYACGGCGKELSNADRINGRWVAKYPKKSYRRGYWVNQMMAPWVTAAYIVDKYKHSTPEFFHNFVLGLPYISADIVLDREVIMNANSPGKVVLKDVCMGVDNGIIKHYVIGTPNGVFKTGETESWEEIEALFNMYNCTAMVIDANPYPVVPKRLVERYPGRVFMNYYVQDKKELGVVRWGAKASSGVVNSDRTRLLDQVANEIQRTEIIFTMKPTEMEDLIEHCMNIYRTVEEDNNGMKKGKWIRKEGKPDHLFHALAYWRIAILKAFEGGGQVVNPLGSMQGAPVGYTTNPDTLESDYKLDIQRVARQTEGVEDDVVSDE